MAKTATPRPCANGCGRQVIGRTKLCEECVPRCACGQRKRAGHRTCYACRPSEAEPIAWVKNRRGIFVARR